MKKSILLLLVFLGFYMQSNAQLKSSEDNSEYAIAQKIAEKAKQRNLGAVHSESPKMRRTAGKGGWFLRYEHGWVYYNPKLKKAFAIMENMMKKWGEAGYEVGWMGFPISDNLETPKVYGFYTAFENGSIYSSAKNGMHFVGGAFRDEWGRRGYENSPDLGFPKTDEIAINVNGYTRYQQFERGTLFFGNGKPILYSNNPNATTPPKDDSMELAFIPKSLTGFESTIDVNEGSSIELYGWMDLRVYRGNGQEISDADGKSYSLFNIQKKQAVDVDDFTPYFFNENTASRHYNITQSDIDGNAYIRITYWLNDKDISNSDDYLKLENYNGRWNYNGGDHPYREIKLKEIIRNGKAKNFMDKGSDGSDSFRASYDFTIKNN
jgi:hypothetical protein